MFFKRMQRRTMASSARTGRRMAVFTLTLLAIEFLDELVYGAREAAWPLIRDDLHLTYAQVGLLLGVPTLIANLVEPPVFLLGDVWSRRAVVVGGGLAFTGALLLTGTAWTFPVLMLAFTLLYPASGAFVTLSQASLMDTDPQRHEQLMARWTLAGSVGVVAGPLALTGAVLAGAGWRGLFIAFAALSMLLTLVAWRQPYSNGGEKVERNGFRFALKGAFRALLRKEVLRWQILLEFSDFMLDILLGFLALYLVDVVGVSPALAATGVAVWSGAGLMGDALVVPLLEQVNGLKYIRWTALVMLLLYPAFLLAPSWPAKLGLLAAMGIFGSGWYAILAGRGYSEMPGQSGTAAAVSSLFGIVVSFVPALLGYIAEGFSLPVTMWLLALGPAALLLGVPRYPGQSPERE